MNSSGAVLFLHGQPGSARDWDPVLAALSGLEVAIVLERPGWDGRSATDLAGNARAALAALDGRGAKRAVVVGHSFGGAVAAWLAVHHPERVTALVLAAPSANRRSLYALDHVLGWPLAGPLLSSGVLASAGLMLGWTPARRSIAKRLGLDERYLGALARLLAKPSSWRAFVVEQRALIRGIPQLEARLGHISAPTVIVAGAADQIVPIAASRALAGQIPGAELVLVPRAGHLLPLRHPERLAKIIAGLAGCRLGLTCPGGRG